MTKNEQTFLIHSDSVEADDGDAMDTLQSSSTRLGSKEVLVSSTNNYNDARPILTVLQSNKSPNSQSPTNFATAYRKADTDKVSCKENMRINRKKQKAVRDEIEALKSQLTDLELESLELEEENRRLGVKKRGLCDSLSEKDRALFVLGREMAQRASRRARKGSRSETDSSEGED
jgi:hypothetical protein